MLQLLHSWHVHFYHIYSANLALIVTHSAHFHACISFACRQSTYFNRIFLRHKEIFTNFAYFHEYSVSKSKRAFAEIFAL